MQQILLFAGTVEGRHLVEHFQDAPFSFTVCVATEYGKEILPQGKRVEVLAQRLSMEEMKELMQRKDFLCVIDATHPYAVEVSQNIQAACEQTKLRYFRLQRPSVAKAATEEKPCIWVRSVQEAVAYLNQHQGNVLLTTGSKELAAFTKVADFTQRIYARVLPLPEGIAEAIRLGYPAAHLWGMQGPFSVNMNVAMLQEIDAAFLVTKESGKAGGFAEKLAAAAQTGATAIVIQRPVVEDGWTEQQMIHWLEEHDK